ncbi:serine protease [Pontibaca methylaminivorans]|uniref:Putative peptidoglycan binding domain-containing protein n=1 Tax=Pontibaca methylaminivorans TaxID=515897 RepID=A0A1R3WHB3_9RHOB|nr:serine protease [Pontibaca methylaminivorans]SIT77591.1 Putative peptidoglycan binding domain-containing protein [Pontibaca methylaminivorans]
MKSVLACLIVALMALSLPAAAQDSREMSWVQIEARPTLSEAEARARDWGRNLADVNGFALGSGWYAIVLGPYSRADAERVLQVYRTESQIPADSFIARPGSLGQRFWPVGAAMNSATLPDSLRPDPDAAQRDAAQPGATATPQDPGETPEQARAAERLLSGKERQTLQQALRAGGFYAGAIDGAFGAGTRRSMADWQGANGYPATGVLTTREREALIAQYEAPLTEAGMELVHDREAGIEMRIPGNLVAFTRHESPFAVYGPAGDSGVQVLLISQAGNEATLAALYEVLQSLTIIPTTGPRDNSGSRFVIEGRDDASVAHAEATLDDREIKGFVLVWPAGDDMRRTRVLAAMQESFTRRDGVLDSAMAAPLPEDLDLVAGLETRKPRVGHSGFYVDHEGRVLTTADVAASCSRLTIDGHEARLLAQDETLGLALIEAEEPRVPMGFARLRSSPLPLRSDVTLSGYSYGGALDAPVLTHGELADNGGLEGEREQLRLSLKTTPGDEGGPILDAGGEVVAMLLPWGDASRELPEGVSLGLGAGALRGFLDRHSGDTQETAPESAPGPLTPAGFARLANGMTVFVNCWE